jgi:hypothetical protein
MLGYYLQLYVNQFMFIQPEVFSTNLTNAEIIKFNAFQTYATDFFLVQQLHNTTV